MEKIQKLIEEHVGYLPGTGSRAMPHFEHLSPAFPVTSGCIGQA